MLLVIWCVIGYCGAIMTECTNVTCDKEATHQVSFVGVNGAYPYCEEHCQSLKEIEPQEHD